MNLQVMKEAFVVPGDNSIIDIRHPETGRSAINGDTLEEIQARYPGAIIVALDDWIAAKATRQRTPVQWRKCSPAHYHEMLNVLPPALMEAGGFLVGEPSDHEADTGRPRFAAFRHTKLGHLEADRPMTRVEFRAALQA